MVILINNSSFSQPICMIIIGFFITFQFTFASNHQQQTENGEGRVDQQCLLNFTY